MCTTLTSEVVDQRTNSLSCCCSGICRVSKKTTRVKLVDGISTNVKLLFGDKGLAIKSGTSLTLTKEVSGHSK